MFCLLVPHRNEGLSEFLPGLGLVKTFSEVVKDEFHIVGSVILGDSSDQVEIGVNENNGGQYNPAVAQGDREAVKCAQ